MKIEVDSTSDRAVFRQIADQLRHAIEGGELLAGDKVPSETEIMQMTGVARMTVRQALQLLQSERLLVAEHGRGVFVRRRPPVLRIAEGRFSPEARGRSAGAFAAEAERLGLPWRQEVRSIDTEKPSPDLRERLDLAANAKVLVRRRRMFLDDRPVQLADSYFPLSLVKGSAIVSADTGPGGSYSRLADLGVVLDRAREELSVRMPTSDEQRLLGLTAPTPVVRLIRTVWDDRGRPVEVFDSVCVGENYVFAYDIPLR